MGHYSATVFLRGATEGTGTPVRVIHISDTHNRRYTPPDGDILIHTGDFTNGGSDQEMHSFREWFLGLPHKHKVVIFGNHEFNRTNFEHNRDFLGPTVSYLQDSGCQVLGISIWGSPWNNSSQFFGADENGRAKMFDMVPEGTEILLTHNPPALVLDLAWHSRVVSPGTCGECNESHPNFSHWGCRALRKVVENRAIPLHLFGHVHDQTGVVVIGPTTYCNAAMDIDKKAAVITVFVPPPSTGTFSMGHILNRAGQVRALGVDDQQTQPGTPVILRNVLDPTRYPNQLWKFDNGRIHSGLGCGLVLDVGSDGSLMTGIINDDRLSQKWQLLPDGRLVNVHLQVCATTTSGSMHPTAVPYDHEHTVTEEMVWTFFTMVPTVI